MPNALHNTDQRLRWFVFLILVAAYLLIYINTPDSADGDALLAVSAALVRTGTADISVIGAQDAQFAYDMSRMGVFGVDGALYSKKGLTPSLALIPLTVAAQAAPWLPLRATAMLFNPLVTALTAAALYTLIRETGLRPRTALVTALLYGVATTAAVYTKTLFGEPLAALLLLIAAIESLRFRRHGRLSTLTAAGLAVGLAAGINLTYLLAAAIIGVFILHAAVLQRRGAAPILHACLAYGTPLLLCSAGIVLYNAARFGSPLTSGYYFGSGEGFNRPFLLGLFGLTISPYRGLLWYSPLVLLALPGAWLFMKQQRDTTLLTIALVAAQFATYASWWSWHGGVVWGPRFLLPALPLLMLLAAPVIERAAGRASLRRFIIALGALSLGIQIPGILLSPYPFYGVLSGRYGTGDMSAVVATLRDDVLTDIRANAVIGHLELLAHGAALDPAWLRSGDWIILISALLLGGAALSQLHTPHRWRVTIGAATCLITLNLVAARQMHDPSVERALGLERSIATNAPVLVASSAYGSALLDIETRRVLSVHAPSAPDDRLALAMWQHAQALDAQLWLVTWFPPADPRNWMERDSWESRAFAAELFTDGHRALLFREMPQIEMRAGGWHFGEIGLRRYGLARADDALIVALEWEARSAGNADAAWFVHVLDAQGTIIAQQDRAPQGGYQPSGSWGVGDIVTDRLIFTDAGAGTALRIGWVEEAGGTRLAAESPAGEPLADNFVILPVLP
jgi:hypothetical protein